MTSWNEQKAEVWQSGFDALNFKQCPFVSGQKMYAVWIDGFVAARLIRPEVPEDTPVFIAGRIARLQGLPLDNRPETELGPSWMAGWVKQGQIPLERIAPEGIH